MEEEESHHECRVDVMRLEENGMSCWCYGSSMLELPTLQLLFDLKDDISSRSRLEFPQRLSSANADNLALS